MSFRTREKSRRERAGKRNSSTKTQSGSKAKVNILVTDKAVLQAKHSIEKLLKNSMETIWNSTDKVETKMAKALRNLEVNPDLLQTLKTQERISQNQKMILRVLLRLRNLDYLQDLHKQNLESQCPPLPFRQSLERYVQFSPHLEVRNEACLLIHLFHDPLSFTSRDLTILTQQLSRLIGMRIHFKFSILMKRTKKMMSLSRSDKQ